MVSRTLLRSSSIPEPSDPPSRVIIFSITTIVIWSSFDYHLCQIVSVCVFGMSGARASAPFLRGAQCFENRFE